MKEKKIQAFVEIVKHYFSQFSNNELVIDTSYLSEEKQPQTYDYTGVIGISGIMRGVVYVTASKSLLLALLADMKEDNSSEEMLIDLVGEIANTMAGNARSEFGSEFHISIPLVFKGAPQSMTLPKDGRSFVIPITWRQHAGEIVVCLEADA